jgi:acyl carrier protein
VSTYDRIKKLFLANFEFNESQLTPETTIESLGLDSLDKIEFMFELEKEFDIKIQDREVKLTSIRSIIDAIDRLVLEQHVEKQ